MELVYLVLLLSVLLYWNWRFIGLDRLFGGQTPERDCLWLLKSEATDDHPAVWVCQTCGVDAGTRDGKEPVRCLRAARDY